MTQKVVEGPLMKFSGWVAVWKETWGQCVKEAITSLGLSREDAQARNKWRKRIKGKPIIPFLPGKDDSCAVHE